MKLPRLSYRETVGSNPPSGITEPAALVPPAYDQVRTVTEADWDSTKLKEGLSASVEKVPVND
jgi:hypothetical protein